jgi:hypothetical protein
MKTMAQATPPPTTQIAPNKLTPGSHLKFVSVSLRDERALKNEKGFTFDLSS